MKKIIQLSHLLTAGQLDMPQLFYAALLEAQGESVSKNDFYFQMELSEPAPSPDSACGDGESSIAQTTSACEFMPTKR